MHVLVASDGQLPLDTATELIARIHEPGDTVTVLSAINHPREFLGDYAAIAGVEDVARIAHEAGPGMLNVASGAKAAERLSGSGAKRRRDPGSAPAHPLHDYFVKTTESRLGPLVDRLAVRGIEATAAWVPTENQTARTILEYAALHEAELLVIGSHGRGRFEGALGSTSTKLMRRAPMPVVVIR